MRASSTALLMAACVMAAGCSESYRAERLFWKAQHQHEAVLKNPSAATPEQFHAAVQSFSSLIDQAPGSNLAGRAQLMIGTLYTTRKEFDSARKAYGLVIQNYNRYGDLPLRARLSIAKTYEAEGKWHEAVGMYKDVTEYHAWSRLGLETPLYVAAGYEQRKQPAEATAAYERAVRLYGKMVPDAPNPDLAMQVKGYLTLAYQRLGQWDKAIALLEELAAADKGGVNRPLVLLTLGSIYETKVNNPAKADSWYARLLEDFPEHPLGKVAQTQREKLGIGGKAAAPSAPAPAPAATP